MKISFVGGGVMAEAILSGIVGAKVAQSSDICVGEPSENRRRHLEETYSVRTTSNNIEAIEGAGLTVLAVKPQTLPYVYPELNGNLSADNTVVSIVAGATMSRLNSGLGHAAIIRVMPNTPGQIGAGMTMWMASDAVPKETVDTARAIVQTLGKEIYTDDEKMIDMATALSASGPAYVFLFIESLIDAGVYVGLPRDMARTLALQTVYGSVRLVSETGRHPAELKDMVVSPGGTTAEGLRALEKGGLSGLMVEAVDAAYQKSIKLGQG
jgi:pyrroline-5-carboxylate reductase